jgi:putative MFS transporter
MSFFCLGAWGVIYTYTPELYPTHLRGRGAGFAAAFGRLGGVIGPFAVGPIMMALGDANGQVFIFSMFAAVLLLIALDVAVLGEETKGKTLEEIAG